MSIKCFYCERSMSAARFGGPYEIYATKDHIHPKSLGGKGNRFNTVNACNECNFLKGNLLLAGFMAKVIQFMIAGKPYKSITTDIYPVILKNALQLYIKRGKR